MLRKVKFEFKNLNEKDNSSSNHKKKIYHSHTLSTYKLFFTFFG
jgi:hypothetical protein